MIVIPLTYHGSTGSTRGVEVSLGDELDVDVRIDGEEDGEQSIYRTLTADEARALAVALIHHADEAVRRGGAR